MYGFGLHRRCSPAAPRVVPLRDSQVLARHPQFLTESAVRTQFIGVEIEYDKLLLKRVLPPGGLHDRRSTSLASGPPHLPSTTALRLLMPPAPPCHCYRLNPILTTKYDRPSPSRRLETSTPARWHDGTLASQACQIPHRQTGNLSSGAPREIPKVTNSGDRGMAPRDCEKKKNRDRVA